MVSQTLQQALPALVLGPAAIAGFWFGRTGRFTSRVFDAYLQAGKATYLDRTTIVARLQAVATIGMGFGVVVTALGLVALISG